MGATIENLSLQETWEKVIQVLNEKPEPFANEELIYQFEYVDESVTYCLVLSNGVAKVENGPNEAAQCTLSMNVDSFKKLLKGQLNSTVAYMTGKLKVKGSLGLALKMESMLKQYQF